MLEDRDLFRFFKEKQNNVLQGSVRPVASVGPDEEEGGRERDWNRVDRLEE